MFRVKQNVDYKTWGDLPKGTLVRVLNTIYIVVSLSNNLESTCREDEDVVCLAWEPKQKLNTITAQHLTVTWWGPATTPLRAAEHEVIGFLVPEEEV